MYLSLTDDNNEEVSSILLSQCIWNLVWKEG